MRIKNPKGDRSRYNEPPPPAPKGRGRGAGRHILHVDACNHDLIITGDGRVSLPGGVSLPDARNLAELMGAWACPCHATATAFVFQERDAAYKVAPEIPWAAMQNGQSARHKLENAYGWDNYTKKTAPSLRHVTPEIYPEPAEHYTFRFFLSHLFTDETQNQAARLLYNNLAGHLPTAQTSSANRRAARELIIYFGPQAEFLTKSRTRTARVAKGSYRRGYWGRMRTHYDSASYTERFWTARIEPVRYIWLCKHNWNVIAGVPILDVLKTTGGLPVQVVALLQSPRNNHRAALCNVRRVRGGGLKLQRVRFLENKLY